MVSSTIGARLINDGTLITAGHFDETGQTYTGHKITVDTIFADEIDEVTMGNAFVSGGSLSLNGTSNYITVQGSSDFQFGLNDFTIEGWFKLNSTTFTRLWCFPNGDNLEAYNGALYYWNGGSPISSGGNTVIQGIWFHVAMCKHNGVINVYFNGSSIISDNAPYNSTGSRAIAFGGDVTGDTDTLTSSTFGYLSGNMTNIRIIKGDAIYTGNFSTPISPFTSIPNTVLLLEVADSSHLVTDSSGTSKMVTNNGCTYSTSTPLSTVYNGAMKQLKTGTLQVANEFDEITTI